MAYRNRTIIRQEQSYSAADAPITDNLPVNPISFVDVVLRGQTSTANTLPSLVNILAALDKLEVLYKGSSIVSLTPRDLFALNYAMKWARQLPQPRGLTDNQSLAILLRICFGRRPFDLTAGFPAAKAGELQIRYTPAASFTNVESMSLHVETEELLEATFNKFLKYTTLSRTPSATGESDQLMPIGNKYLGVLLFGTTAPTGTSKNASMREVRLLMDNQEAFVPRTRWDDLHQTFMANAGPAAWLAEHVHLENTAGAYAQNADTGGPRWDAHALNLYGFLDFDPNMDNAFLLETAGRSEVKLRINADAADAQRIIPVEWIETGTTSAA